ncbi:hypothetical protein QYF61_011210 [Mycteria americana]|uniref:Uncharacterized protein n=1 Tax=Mycteria americana TaxID=33587 RepID=A0AAN7NT29_MYCAM|nr:hypothetical protein QYF61_011210 [Mycteria americana]
MGERLGRVKVGVVHLPHTQAISVAGLSGCSVWRLKSWLGCCGHGLMANSSESCWWPATSGIPWGLLLQPHQHGLGTESIPSKFTGAWWDRTASQRNVDRLDRNLIKFNYRRCQVLHLGWKSPRHQYMLGTSQFESRSAEKALGVLVDKLTMSGPPSWSTSYTSRDAGLLSLEKTRLLGDIFSYLRGAYREDRVILFLEVHRKRVRGNSHMLQQGKFGFDERKGVFHQKWWVVKHCTRLHGEAGESPSSEVFIARQGKDLRNPI